jgi:hypothetical protein
MHPTLLRTALLLAASVCLSAAPPSSAPGAAVAAEQAARVIEKKRGDEAAIYDSLQRGDVVSALARIRERPAEAGATADSVAAREFGSAALTALNRADAATTALAAREALDRLNPKQISARSRRDDRAADFRLRALLLERAMGRPEDAVDAWRGVLAESPGDPQATRALALIEERARLRRIRSEELSRDQLKPGYRPSAVAKP